MRFLTRPTSALWTIGLVLGGLLCGCGGDPPPSTTPQGGASADGSRPDAASADAGAADTADATTTNPVVTSGHAAGGPSLVSVVGGKARIGDIPLDVWFDDPLAVAADSQSVPTAPATGGVPATTPAAPGPAAGTDTVAATEPTPMPMPMPMETPMAGGAGSDWKSIISGEAIDAEVTSIRNRFNQDLQTLGNYNRSYLALPPHIATLAVMAAVAVEHPDEIRWKEHAPLIRHLAGKMGAEQLRTGAASYRPLNENFLYILDTLSGNPPAGLESPADQTVADVAEFRELMKRLETAWKYLKDNGGTADAVKKNADDLKHEAMVLGAISRVLSHEGYGYGGDPGFDGHVDTMVKSSQEMREAIETEQFEKYELSVSKMFQACQECHSNYRG